MTDYVDDPIKSMVRKYDRAVVAKGERSIFALKGWKRRLWGNAHGKFQGEWVRDEAAA